VKSMTLEDVRRVLEAEVIVGKDLLHRRVKMGCGSDLMSDVLAFIKPASLLLTGLTNQQTVRTAEMQDIVAICFVRGKKPTDETVKLAQLKNIPLLATRFRMFEACGRLYTEGLPGDYEATESG
jgi:predicted transcriptional regulator